MSDGTTLDEAMVDMLLDSIDLAATFGEHLRCIINAAGKRQFFIGSYNAYLRGEVKTFDTGAAALLHWGHEIARGLDQATGDQTTKVPVLREVAGTGAAPEIAVGAVNMGRRPRYAMGRSPRQGTNGLEDQGDEE